MNAIAVILALAVFAALWRGLRWRDPAQKSLPFQQGPVAQVASVQTKQIEA